LWAGGSTTGNKAKEDAAAVAAIAPAEECVTPISIKSKRQAAHGIKHPCAAFSALFFVLSFAMQTENLSQIPRRGNRPISIFQSTAHTNKNILSSLPEALSLEKEEYILAFVNPISCNICSISPN
jgi:hypothetical protein